MSGYTNPVLAKQLLDAFTFMRYVIFQHLFKQYRGEIIDINACIENIGIVLQQGPILCICVLMNMSVYHVAAPAHRIPAHHRIMTQDEFSLSVADFRQSIDGKKVLCDINFADPGIVMIPENEMLFTFQSLQILFGQNRVPEKKITDNVYRIPVCNSSVPVFDECFIHFLNIGKRPAAQLNDVCMTEMLVSGEIDHEVLLSIHPWRDRCLKEPTSGSSSSKAQLYLI